MPTQITPAAYPLLQGAMMGVYSDEPDPSVHYQMVDTRDYVR